jgi:hypothetical protein
LCQRSKQEKDLQITKLIAPYLLPNAALKRDRRDRAHPLALRQFEKSILEKHTLFPCWIQGLAIARASLASSRIISIAKIRNKHNE